MADAGEVFLQGKFFFVGPAFIVVFHERSNRFFHRFGSLRCDNSGHLWYADRPSGSSQALLDLAPSVFLRGQNTSDASEEGLLVAREREFQILAHGVKLIPCHVVQLFDGK